MRVTIVKKYGWIYDGEYDWKYDSEYVSEYNWKYDSEEKKMIDNVNVIVKMIGNMIVKKYIYD